MSTESETRRPKYEIRVSGRLDPERASWFGDLALTVERAPDGKTVTVLSGPVADRAALFGILSRIRDLGLALISVNPLGMDTRGSVCDESRKEES